MLSLSQKAILIQVEYLVYTFSYFIGSYCFICTDGTHLCIKGSGCSPVDWLIVSFFYELYIYTHTCILWLFALLTYWLCTFSSMVFKNEWKFGRTKKYVVATSIPLNSQPTVHVCKNLNSRDYSCITKQTPQTLQHNEINCQHMCKSTCILITIFKNQSWFYCCLMYT